jgi:hypothetical protein
MKVQEKCNTSPGIIDFKFDKMARDGFVRRTLGCPL